MKLTVNFLIWKKLVEKTYQWSSLHVHTCGKAGKKKKVQNEYVWKSKLQ